MAGTDGCMHMVSKPRRPHNLDNIACFSEDAHKALLQGGVMLYCEICHTDRFKCQCGRTNVKGTPQEDPLCKVHGEVLCEVLCEGVCEDLGDYFGVPLEMREDDETAAQPLPSESELETLSRHTDCDLGLCTCQFCYPEAPNPL